MVKWLPAFTLHCLWTRSLGTKGLLVSPPPPSPPDRFFLFNQRVKWETQGKKKKNWKKGKVAGGGLKARTCNTENQSREFALPSPCNTEGKPAKRSQSFPHSQPPLSPRYALVVHLASLCHRPITYIISLKITQSNLYLPTSSPRSLFEICFNK